MEPQQIKNQTKACLYTKIDHMLHDFIIIAIHQQTKEHISWHQDTQCFLHKNSPQRWVESPFITVIQFPDPCNSPKQWIVAFYVWVPYPLLYHLIRSHLWGEEQPTPAMTTRYLPIRNMFSIILQMNYPYNKPLLSPKVHWADTLKLRLG